MQIKKKIKISGIILFLSCMFLTLLFSYNKRVNITIDGKEEIHYTNAITHEFLADEIADEYGFEEYVLEKDSDNPVLENNENIEIKSKKNIEVYVDGALMNVETYSTTTEDLVDELDLEESDGVEYLPIVFTSLKDGQSLRVVKLETVIEEEVATEELEKVTVEDPAVVKGITTVVSKGEPSQYNNVYEVTYYEGEEYSRTLLEKELIKEGSPETVRVGTKEIPKVAANYASGDSVWDSIAACESGGNWAINTGNGYYGGLQFSAATWNTASSAVGVSAEYAHLATREEQIRAAEWILSKSTWQQQWPSCSKQLGLW